MTSAAGGGVADTRPRCLVAGWFSFGGGGATAGDLLTRDLTCEWLETAGYHCEIAGVPPFDGVDWRTSDPTDYPLVVFVCGPFARGEFEDEFLEHFRECRLVGVNLSMLVPQHEWRPFDLLFERDSSEAVNPDLVFLTRRKQPPVVGVCLVEDYPDALVDEANTAIERLVSAREMSVVRIDTRLEKNETGLRTPGEVEALISRMDALITTRLHGTVLALKNGVPALAIDVLGDGRKILRQCERVGWPAVFPADALIDDVLARSLDYCLSPEGRTRAVQCAAHARSAVEEIRERFIRSLTTGEASK
jgi:hypothetical protein